VMHRYCSAPTVLRKRVGSKNKSPSQADKCVEDAIGQLIGFALAFLFC